MAEKTLPRRIVARVALKMSFAMREKNVYLWFAIIVARLSFSLQFVVNWPWPPNHNGQTRL